MKAVVALALLGSVQLATAGLQEFLQSHYDNHPWVITTKGGVVGRTIEALDAPTATKPYTKTYAFQGIPYAKAPVGNLRFANPVEADPWFVKNATSYGKRCVQRAATENYFAYPRAFGPEYFNDTSALQSEDCLFINVFSPNTSYFAKLPVLFMIHGGGFEVGSGDYFNAEAVAENLASRGIVVVTFNYRLAMFGFLASVDGVATGRYGNEDQVFALKWTNANIRRFGGDPDKVTVFGFSAGSASASLLSLEEEVQSMFRGYILMGGSAFRQFMGEGRDALVTSASSSLAENANCSSTTDGQAIIDCLRALTTEEIMYYNPMRGVNWFTAWKPVVPNKRALLEARSVKPSIIGNDGDEFPAGSAASQTKAGAIATAVNFVDNYYFPASGDHSLLELAVKAAYNIDAPECANEADFYETLIDHMKGDNAWHAGSYLDVNDIIKKNSTAYLYNYNYPCDECPFNDRVTLHGDAMVSLMGKEFFARIYDLNEKDLEMSELFTRFLVNFVKTQNPNSDLPSGAEAWNPVTMSAELAPANYYDFDASAQTNKADFYPQSRILWADLLYKITDQLEA